MEEPTQKKLPRAAFLLRKSRGASRVVLDRADFPFRFTVGGKNYVTSMTRKGGIVTTAE